MAKEAEHRRDEASAQLGLGNAYYGLRQYPRALESYQQAFDIAQEIGAYGTQIYAQCGLGNAYSNLQQYSRAIEFYHRAVETAQEIGDLRIAADTLYNLGLEQSRVLKPIEVLHEALQSFQQARNLYSAMELEARIEACDQAIKGIQCAYSLRQFFSSLFRVFRWLWGRVRIRL